MNKLSSLLVSAFLVFALQGYAADTHQKAGTPTGQTSTATQSVHWGYTGAGSPEKWGDLDAKYATCKTGKYQWVSP